MSRCNDDKRRREDNERDRVSSGNAETADRSRTASLLDEPVVGEADGADDSTLAKARPAARRDAIGNGLLVLRMMSYAAFFAA